MNPLDTSLLSLHSALLSRISRTKVQSAILCGNSTVCETELIVSKTLGQAESVFTIYPNPAADILRINLLSKGLGVAVSSWIYHGEPIPRVLNAQR